MFYLGPRVKSRAWHSFYWKSVLLKEGGPLYDKGSEARTVHYLQKQVVAFHLRSLKIIQEAAVRRSSHSMGSLGRS